MTGANDHHLRLLVASLLRELRETGGLTQADLAARLGTQQSFVSKYEAGERRIDVIELKAICDALKIPFADVAARLDVIWSARS